jgi:hypothetical protein
MQGFFSLLNSPFRGDIYAWKSAKREEMAQESDVGSSWKNIPAYS